MSLITEIAERHSEWSYGQETPDINPYGIAYESLQDLVLELPQVLDEIFNENGWSIQEEQVQCRQVMLHELFEKIREKVVD